MSIGRRKFLGTFIGASAFIMLAEPACKKPESINGPGLGPNGFSFGTGDIAMLNFLYLLEQVSAYFYSHVTKAIYNGAPADEVTLLADIALQEITHREFFKTALGSNAIPELQIDFSSIDFSNRAAVLTNAILIEDLGIQSGNSAAGNIQSVALMTIAAEIISVESRHASYIHELVSPDGFTGGSLIDLNSLEIILKPQDALIRLNPFIKTKLDGGSIRVS